jgi:hypothetical protein
MVIQKGKPRFCIDLREVNSKTTPDRYALPRQDTIFRAIGRAMFFSTLDCNKGYHQFGLTPHARLLTAFVTKDGFWEYIRMPFGLKNALAHFQRTMDAILGKYRWDFALAYIDDIVIFSQTFDEHLEHCSLVLDAMEKIGLTLEEKKCHFCYDDIELLGHHISRLGLSTQAEKVQAILAVPFPETIKKAQEILGMFNYYRIFIQHFAWIAAPLYDGLKKQFDKLSHSDPKIRAWVHSNRKFPDTPETRNAFRLLQQALASSPVLIHPDFEREFILYIDACALGVAGNLHQVSLEDGKEHPILYISRRLNKHESKYTATELECLGLVWSLDKLAHYMDGSQLRLVTDHNALKWIWGIKSDVNARLFKWSLILSSLKDKVTIVHCPGHFHQNVDPLSRNPASYAVTLIHLSTAWKKKLANGYQKDPYFRRIIRNLKRSQNRKGGTHEFKDLESRPEPTNASSEPTAETLGPDGPTITDGTFTLIDKTLYFSTKKDNNVGNSSTTEVVLNSVGLCPKN